MGSDDTKNYVFDDGRNKFIKEGGYQTSSLTLNVPVVESIKIGSTVTYKCSVGSGMFEDAPYFLTDVITGMCSDSSSVGLSVKFCTLCF